MCPAQRRDYPTSAIRTGDIMIKHMQSFWSAQGLIKIGQVVTKGKSSFIHAGIASSAATMIEVDGSGVHENDLYSTNALTKYDVFRCKFDALAQGAAQVAIMIYEGVNAGNFQANYSTGDAIKSLFRSAASVSSDRVNQQLDVLLRGGSLSAFCSGFVVYCYLAAVEQCEARRHPMQISRMQTIFSNEAVAYNPSFLHHSLLMNRTQFDFVATVRGAVPV
jgi:hypothetical protein